MAYIKPSNVWLAGSCRVIDSCTIIDQIYGLFSTKELAIKSCTDSEAKCFVGPLAIDEPFPEDLTDWPGVNMICTHARRNDTDDCCLDCGACRDGEIWS